MENGFHEKCELNRYIEIFSQSGSANDAGARFVNSLKISISGFCFHGGFGHFCLAGFPIMRLPDCGLSLKIPLLMATMFFQLLPTITLVIPPLRNPQKNWL